MLQRSNMDKQFDLDKNYIGITGKKLNLITVKSYRTFANHIINEYGNIREELFEIISNRDDLGYKKSKYMIVLWTLSNSQLRDKWRSLVNRVVSEEKEKNLGKKATKKEENFFQSRLSLEQTLIAMKEFMVSNKTYKTIFDCLIAHAYVIQPPLRVNEYYNSIIVNYESEISEYEDILKKETEPVFYDGKEYRYNIINLSTGKMYICVHKTMTTVGPKIIELDKRFVDILMLWRNFIMKGAKTKIPWFAMNSNKDGKIAKDTLIEKIKSVFNGRATKILRKLYVSWFVGKYFKDMEKRKWLSRQMLHSIEKQTFVYNIFENENESSIIEEWIPF